MRVRWSPLRGPSPVRPGGIPPTARTAASARSPPVRLAFGDSHLICAGGQGLAVGLDCSRNSHGADSRRRSAGTGIRGARGVWSRCCVARSCGCCAASAGAADNPISAAVAQEPAMFDVTIHKRPLPLVASDDLHRHRRAAIQPPRFFARVVVLRIFLAEADGGQPVRRRCRWTTRYCITERARRSPSARLYSAVPMLQVWPSIRTRSVGIRPQRLHGLRRGCAGAASVSE